MRSLAISQGLRNWIRVWGDRDLELVERERNRPKLVDSAAPVGFIRYAREYWSLAVIMYNRFDYTHSSKVDSSRTTDSSQGMGFRKTSDSSDMGQLHELVVRFRDVDLSQALI